MACCQKKAFDRQSWPPIENLYFTISMVARKINAINTAKYRKKTQTHDAMCNVQKRATIYNLSGIAVNFEENVLKTIFQLKYTTVSC